MTILEAHEQGLIKGKYSDQRPSSFISDQHSQTSYKITHITNIRTNRVYTLQEGKQQNIRKTFIFILFFI